jgi:cytochrome c peroxidase
MAFSCDRDVDLVAIDSGEISALTQFVLSASTNPITEEKRKLGRQLFWDPILSGTKNVA